MKERLEQVTQIARLIILLWWIMIIIIYELSLPVNQVKIDTYYFRLMLVFVRLFLFLIWYFMLFLILLGLSANKLGFWRSQEIQDLLVQCPGRSWSCSGSCMLPTLKMPYHKWESSLFTSSLSHNFTLVKVDKVQLTGGTFLHLVKFKNVHR